MKIIAVCYAAAILGIIVWSCVCMYKKRKYTIMANGDVVPRKKFKPVMYVRMDEIGYEAGHHAKPYVEDVALSEN